MSVCIETQFDRNKISKDEDYEGHLMVTVEAEDRDFERTPLCIALVLDTSGSMCGQVASGQTKIGAVKDVAAQLVRNLTSKDRLSIVKYDSHVETLLPMGRAGDKEKALAAIERLEPGSCTNLSGGLLEGLAQIDEKFEGVRRVMLLTDGLANQGVSDNAGLLKLVKGRDSKASISTFGFGTNADQELLASMAKEGSGNYYFIEDTRDCKSVFARELGGIASCVAQNIELLVTPNKNNEVLSVLNDFDVEDAKEGRALIKADDIYVGETKHVLVKMKVGKPDGSPKDRPFSVAHVKVRYDLVGEGAVREERELNPKVTFVKAEDADKDPVLEVAEQVGILEAAKAQAEAVRMANVGNFAGAQNALRSAGVVLQSLGSRGSQRSIKAKKLFDASIDNFKVGKYTADYGAAKMSDSEGTLKYRATTDVEGGMSNLYENKSMKDMGQKFNDAPGQTPEANAPKKEEEPKSGFSKKRRSKR